MEAILHEKAGERLEIGLENSKIEINIWKFILKNWEKLEIDINLAKISHFSVGIMNVRTEKIEFSKKKYKT